MIDEAEITYMGLLDTQVCVPERWTDEEVEEWTNSHYPTGCNMIWKIRKTGSPFLCGSLERVPCSSRKGFVHIMLDC